MRLTQGAGVQLALEAVGGDVTVKSMRCLAPFGMLVNYGNASNQPASLPLSSFREQRAAMSALEIKLPERQIRNMGSYYIRFYLEAFTFFSHSKLPNP